MIKERTNDIRQGVEGVISRILYPQTIRLNTDTALIKWIALIAMCFDHAGKMLFPQLTVMREIGRLAFPLYAYCAAMGMVRTRDPMRYIARITGLALLSQPLYALALAHTSPRMFAIPFMQSPLQAVWNFFYFSWGHPSILISLVCGLGLLWMLRERQFILFAAGLLLCMKVQGNLDYGLRGIILMLLFYTLCEFPRISFCAVSAFMVYWAALSAGYTFFGMRFGLQVFALPALFLIYMPWRSKVRMPKFWGYASYPLHLVALMVALFFTGYWA